MEILNRPTCRRVTTFILVTFLIELIINVVYFPPLCERKKKLIEVLS